MNVEIIFQLLSLGIVLITGPLVIILLASRNGNL